MARPPQAVQRSPWLVLLTVLVVVGLWWFTSSEDEPATPGNGSTVAGAQQTPGATSAPTDSTSSATPSAAERSLRSGSPSSAPSVTAKPKAPSRAASPTPSPSRGDASPRAPSAVDEHGLPWVDAADLPHPAQDVLAAIDAGGPFAHEPKDGSTFGNYEGVLPQRKRGYYREYTVDTPGVNHRGARRVVTGNGGEFYWTADHYASFSRIRR